MGKRRQIILSVVAGFLVAAPVGFAVSGGESEDTHQADEVAAQKCSHTWAELKSEAEHPDGGYTVEEAFAECPRLRAQAVPSPYGPNADPDDFVTDKELGLE